MSETLRLYLDPAALKRVHAGQHNFFGRLIAAVKSAGWRVEVLEASLENRLLASSRGGYALWHMAPPEPIGSSRSASDRPISALTCRRLYVGAFWHIEAQAERWLWPVAQAPYAPPQDLARAQQFTQYWRGQLFGKEAKVADAGHIFVPLQGVLLEKRSFQSMSPVAMLEALCTRSDRPVQATLHPNEDYSQEELAALEALARRFPRLHVRRGGSEQALMSCHMVATQNSGLGLQGLFLAKPLLLFARSEFHHIAASVPRDGLVAALDAAFDEPPRAAQDYAPYLYWFLQLRSINAGRPECEAQILAAFRAQGWPI